MAAKRGTQISKYLGIGRLNAKTGAYIADFLGWEKREVQQQIERERRNGAPICSSTSRPAGYYLAENKAELMIFCDQMKNRAVEIFKTRKAMLEGLDDLES